MIKHLICAAILSAGVSAAALGQTAEERAEARLAEFTATGETTTCLSTTRIRSITPIDDTRWLVTMRGGGTYINQVSRGCHGAASSFNYLQYQVSGSQLCRGEIVRVIDTGSRMEAGACGLGVFERVEPAAAAGGETNY
ncbi:hypothetical protein L2D00_04075 [Hyphomonadaceae bacterium BL14]|nr:hypothetical protein L2D00_04075 [Hyphomonadaceae bacterium BL14]